MHDPLETSELLAFARTVEAQSLTRAAAELGLPRATVSRRLQRIEQRLGVRLLRRTTRKLTLTDAGEALYHRARSILDAVRDAELSVQRTDDAVRGRLRVTVPPLLPPSFNTVVIDFMERYPDVRLELNATSRHVDLHAEGYDVALRAGGSTDSGLVGRMLQRQRLGLFASPDYLARHGTPTSVGELAKHACLMNYARGELPQSHWPLFRGGSVRVEGTLHCNDLFLLLHAAKRGRGLALLPSVFVEPTTTRGGLVPVLERIVGAETQLMLVYPERELMPAAVRAFIEAVAAWAKDAVLDVHDRNVRCDGRASKRRVKSRATARASSR